MRQKLWRCGVVAVLLIAGCTAGGGKDTETLAVVRENAQYLSKEDLPAYMQTIHEDSPAFSATESMTKEIFDLYDLDYTIESVEQVEKKGDEAKVRFVQVTKKISGPEFRDNRIKGVHTLKKSNGKWKIFDTQISSIEYLDQ